MLLMFFSLIIYAIFGLIGIFLLNKIKFVKKNFSNKQNIIYLSIFFIVLGFFLAQHEPGNTGAAFQVAFGFGNYLVTFLGAVLATFIKVKSKFSLKNKLFYHALFGSISLGTILLLLPVLL
tara:strand:- start:196 stop:558 length:363 start_codon:yes stop_codon:yes gene_type:complete